MSEYLIQGETLTALADLIRAKTGATGSLTPTAMQEQLATLPDAGSGTGGNIETCAVGFTDNSANGNRSFDVYYVDQNGYQTFHVDEGGYETVRVLSNSIVVLNSEYTISVEIWDAAEVIASLDNYTKLVYVSGDADIIIGA